MNKILIIIATEPQRQNAEKLAKFILEKKLASCISLKEINSSYFWEGTIENSDEIEITIKSTIEKKEILIGLLKEKLSNELPQIIFKEFNSELNYFKWIKSNVN